MKIYPDSCIYGRQHDDQTQPDIKADVLTIGALFGVCHIAGYTIMGSKIVEKEILANKDEVIKLSNIAYFKRMVKPCDLISLTNATFRRARVFIAQGLGDMDSYHLAAAESAGVDVLLTVDKDFIRIAANKNLSNVRVLNPYNLLQEIII